MGMGMTREYIHDLRKEFKGYNGRKLTQDLLAGITTAAVALPLALAFGISSGAGAAAGLMAAIVGGILIGLFSGASYQISGPAGALTAILITIVAKYGVIALFYCGFLAGILLVIFGLLRLGRMATYIPGPVIAGFTSGVAVIIALGQINNFFGTTSEGAGLEQIASYFKLGFNPQWGTVAVGGVVVLTMLLWPKAWGKKVPGSLVGLILGTLFSLLPFIDTPTIPAMVLGGERLNILEIPFDRTGELLIPALSIAALNMIESLLCGAAAGRMKGNEKLKGDRELVAQGIGNIITPFFGGMPASAVIARTGVAIKSGGQTRLTGIVHGLVLLLCAFVFAAYISYIPLAALAGVLIITAWRMSEWAYIRHMFSRRMKTAMAQFLFTLIATVVFDLTLAIVIGLAVSAILFIGKISNMDVEVSAIDDERLKARGIDFQGDHSGIRVIYLTGPLFFMTVNRLQEKLSEMGEVSTLIISVRGVPLVDMSGTEALYELCETLKNKGIRMVFCGVQPKVKNMFTRSGVDTLLGEENFFWSADMALRKLGGC